MRKMFLVPVDQYERMQQQRSQNPYTDKMIELEGELQTILNDTAKDPYEKSLLYAQVLQKYLNFKTQQTEASRIKVDFSPPPPPPPVTPPPAENIPPALQVEEK